MWETDAARPDTATIPQLAQILGISVEELLNAKSAPASGHKGGEFFADMVLRAMPLAMGIAVAVTASLGTLEAKHGFSMVGIGLACVGLHMLKQRK